MNEHQQLIDLVIKKNALDMNLPIKRFTGGQINFVYQLGDQFVLKIERDLDVTLHQVSLVKMAVDAGAKVPNIIDSGENLGKRYLLMERVLGEKLSTIWTMLEQDRKENFIKQICEQMKIFHSITFDKYSSQRPREFDTIREALDWQTSLVKIQTGTLDKITKDNVELVREFYHENLQILDERGTAVFVHNDLHFENILFDGDIITGIIDFDFSRQFAKDYELWHIVDFLFKPTYYVEKKLESTWETFELGNELSWFKQYYPSLFDHPQLLTRLRLYFIDQMLSDLQDGATNKFNERVGAYFKDDWLEKHLVGSSNV